jgi:UDPglucose 6-dehydrogenase
VQSWLGRDDVYVVSNPEFLRQGTALQDFLHPARVVIGGSDSRAVEKVVDLYAGVEAPVLRIASIAFRVSVLIAVTVARSSP